jgi:glycine dehydrogenase
MNPQTRSLTSPAFTPDEFAVRHLGLSDADRAHMLSVIGSDSLESLLETTIPASIRLRELLSIKEPVAEHDVLNELRGTRRIRRINPRSAKVALKHY